jgi:two-component system, NtrC family, nitrogen regulation response regulator GlnG
MKEKIKALLVQGRPNPLDALRMALEEPSMEICIANNCGEAALVLWSDRPPHLVFTDVQLTDGHWGDVLMLATKASAPVNVIVVASHVDVAFYISAIERGAFDFIVPPFAAPEILHIVRSAAQEALSRRRAQTIPALPASLAEHQPAED